MIKYGNVTVERIICSHTEHQGAEVCAVSMFNRLAQVENV